MRRIAPSTIAVLLLAAGLRAADRPPQAPRPPQCTLCDKHDHEWGWYITWLISRSGEKRWQVTNSPHVFSGDYDRYDDGSICEYRTLDAATERMRWLNEQPQVRAERTACHCSSACTCGCQDGAPCSCGQARVGVAGWGENVGLPALAPSVVALSSAYFAPPVQMCLPSG